MRMGASSQVDLLISGQVSLSLSYLGIWTGWLSRWTRSRRERPTPARSQSRTVWWPPHPHKILEARRHDHVPVAGTWVVVDSVPVLGVGGEGVELVSLQPSGKTAQSGADWVRGRRREAGVVS